MRSNVLNVYSSEACRKNHTVTVVVIMRANRKEPFEKSEPFSNFSHVLGQIKIASWVCYSLPTSIKTVSFVSKCLYWLYKQRFTLKCKVFHSFSGNMHMY